jgi:hypothetical protein
MKIGSLYILSRKVPGTTPQPAPVDPSSTPVVPEDFATEIRGKIRATENKFLNEGKENGALGIFLGEEFITNRAKSDAASLYEEAKILIAKMTSKLTPERDKKKEALDKATQLLKNEEQKLEYLYHGKQFESNLFDWRSASIYLIIGMFLILADIPLALQLIQIGFRFDEPSKGLTIHALFNDGNFRKVIIANWEVFLTALGVAFCTIIIKLAYDEFIGTQYASGVLKRKKFFEIFQAKPEQTNDSYFDETDIRQINRSEKRKKGIKLLIVVATLILIVTLSFFRVDTLKQKDRKDIFENAKKELLAKVRNLSIEPDEYLESTRNLKNEYDSDINGIRKNTEPTTNLSFILITVLFAVISGICFSMFFSSIRNAVKARATKKGCSRYRKKITEATKEYADVASDYAVWELEKEFISDSNWRQAFEDKLIKLYEYGYNLGRIRPDLVFKIPDLLTLAEEWQKKVNFYKSNQHLLQLTTNEKGYNDEKKQS